MPVVQDHANLRRANGEGRKRGESLMLSRAGSDNRRSATTPPKAVYPLVIAHRLSPIRQADVILMMEHGRIGENGTHEALLAAGGHYAALFESQFAGTPA